MIYIYIDYSGDYNSYSVWCVGFLGNKCATFDTGLSFNEISKYNVTITDLKYGSYHEENTSVSYYEFGLLKSGNIYIQGVIDDIPIVSEGLTNMALLYYTLTKK